MTSEKEMQGALGREDTERITDLRFKKNCKKY